MKELPEPRKTAVLIKGDFTRLPMRLRRHTQCFASARKHIGQIESSGPGALDRLT